MTEYESKSLQEPDEVIQLPSVELSVVDLGDLTVGRAIHQPGWRWSTHVKPKVGGDWCQVRHIGVVLSGRMGIILPDGSTYEVVEDDVFDIPPGHDGYTIGHEPAVLLEWTGIRAFAGFMGGYQNRVLVTLLLSELVDPDTRARELGTSGWRELSSGLFEAVRERFDRFGGREVATTGERTLATFNGPVQALTCAEEMKRLARDRSLRMRSAVHVGEVELVGNDVRGAVVHEAERMVQIAEADEIVASEVTRTLSLGSGLRFDGLKSRDGADGSQLYAYSQPADQS